MVEADTPITVNDKLKDMTVAGGINIVGNKDLNEGFIVGDPNGLIVEGLIVREYVGTDDGRNVDSDALPALGGIELGHAVDDDGEVVGKAVIATVGLAVGMTVGNIDGSKVEDSVGRLDGCRVGTADAVDGIDVGSTVLGMTGMGRIVGSHVGDTGVAVGGID